MRKTGFLRAFITLTIIFALAAVVLFATGVIEVPQGDDNGAEIETVAPLRVTTSVISRTNEFFVETSGITDAQAQIPVYAGSDAQVKEILANEGEFVMAGDPLLVLGGTNDANHPMIYQLEIALQNYATAQKGYDNAVASANASIKSAELQVENARNQTEGFLVDDQVFAVTDRGLQDNEGITQDSLVETRMKNERDIENLHESIDDMEDSLDELEDLEGPEVEAQIKELETQIETAKDQLETLQSGAIIGENQMIGQVMQIENQQHTLQLNRESSRVKMGIDGDSSTSIKIAEQGVESAKVQSDAAVTQAESQLELAKINLDSVQDQVDALIVKAPVSGVVSVIDARIGGFVSPQTTIAEVTNERAYVLKSGIRAEDAARINAGAKAEVLFGSSYVKLPIKSISPVADPASKLVTVTVELPNIKFTSNQAMKVRFPVSPASGIGTLFAPLNAVTIGSNETYVFLNDGGKAKRVLVELGKVDQDMIEIRSGLNGGEEVIVVGAKNLTDGQAIEITN